MTENILESYNTAIDETVKKYKSKYREVQEIRTDTEETDNNPNKVGYNVTLTILQTLKNLLIEKIGYIEIPNITSYQLTTENIFKEQLKFDNRDKEEEINVSEVEALWKQSFETFLTQSKNMEFSLLYDKSFDYNMIEYTSSTFWDFAYQTIDECKKYLEQLTSLNTAEGWEASWNLTVDLGVIQSQLFGLYGKVAPLDNEESKNQLIYDLAYRDWETDRKSHV